MRGRRGAVLAAIGVCVLGLAAGCASHPPVELKDPSKGEFYTPEEVTQLPPAARDQYCEELNRTLIDLKADGDALQARLDSLNAVSDTLRDAAIRVSARTREVNTEVRDLRLKEKAINSYVVKKGDTLRKIAAAVYGDPTRWKEIYEANAALIGPENAPLKPGTRLTIPRRSD